MSISSDESGAELPDPSFPTLPDKEQYTERILTKKGLREFLIVDHTANVRKNAKISAIWHHGSEQVFSVARRTLTPERNALRPQIIEACECLRWWRNGVVTGRVLACAMTPRVEIEAQMMTALIGDSALGEEM
jgi:hypothetical protein